jgi:2-polyprenyl-6-hydroxyphenyl methylase/3-demethylubiquinone-9 3-methyltransferase
MDDGQKDRSIDPREIENFSALASEWWNPEGSFRPLHDLNPIRIGWIKEQICGHFHLEKHQLRPLQDLSVLDVGCGGGLVSEPLALLGASVTGIDASQKNIQVAASHAEIAGVSVDYRCISPGLIGDELLKFDVVLALEVIEHVSDCDEFVQSLVSLTGPNGLLIISTINRTAKAYLMAILGAEYVMRWLPIGTHQWQKFVRPSELNRKLKDHSMEIRDMTGLVFQPLTNEWRLSPNVSVNYLASATTLSG